MAVLGIKRIAAVAFLSLAIASGLLTLAFFTVSDAQLIGWLVQRAELSTDARIRYQDASLHRNLAPTLDVRQLRIDANDGHYHIETASLQLSVSLPYLLLARLDIPLLQIGDTQVTLKTDKESAAADGFDPGPVLEALRFKPVLHDFRITSLAVSAEGTGWELPATRVKEISLQLGADEETSLLAADVDIEPEKLHVGVTLPGFRHALQQQHLPFSVRVNGIHADAELDGVLDFTGTDTMLEAELRARAADLSHYPVAAEGMSIPGELQLKAAITGTLDQLTAETVRASWHDAAGSSMELEGRVGDALELASLDLRLKGALAKAGWLKPALPDSLGDIEEAAVTGALAGSRDRLVLSGLQLDAATSDSLDIHLSGGFELATTDKHGYRVENMQAVTRFNAPTTRAARALLFEQVPEFGALQASADIHSATGDPVFSNVNVKTRSETGIEARLSGRIAQFPLDPDKPNRGYDLDVGIDAGRAQAILQAVDLDLALDGPLQLQFKIQGDTPALQLNAIKLAAGSNKALRIDATGNMRFGDWSRDDPLQSLDLLVDADSHDTQALGRFSTVDGLPEMGALKLHGRVHTVAGRHRVDDFSLSTVKSAPVQIALTGIASDLTLFPAPLLDGLQLEFLGQGDDTAALNTLFDLKPAWIPPIGAFRVVSTVSGSKKIISITDTRIEGGSKDVLAVTATGRLGKFDAGSGLSLHDTHLKLAAKSDSSQALLKAWGYRLPPLGPLAAAAEIHDRDGSPGLYELQMRVGSQPDDAVISARGRIGDLVAAKDVDINAQLNIDGHNLAAFADRRTLQDLAPLTGHLQIGDKTGVLGMQTLVLNSEHEALTIKANAKFTDFSKPETLSVNAAVRARDLALVGALFDQDWPALSPFSMQAVLQHENQQQARLQASLGAAQKTLDADLHGDFSRTPPRISGKLTAGQIAVPDFYAKTAKQRKERQKDRKKAPREIFSRQAIAFERLKKVDLDLDLEVASFDPESSQARSAAMKVKLDSGLLRFHPAVVKYAEGELDLDLSLDARQQPQLRFSARGENINPWEAIPGQPGRSGVDLNGDYDVDIQLSTRGQSSHELASALEGDIFMTMKQGRIRSSFLNLLFVDIVGWAADRVKKQKFDDVICGVADFSARDGVISTNAFLLDLNNITITGKGDVDLGKETVDYVFLPKKKNRLIVKAEPVNISGALADPKVTAIPVKSAALNFGTLIFAPYVFAGLAASDYVSGKLRSGNDTSPCLNYEKTHNESAPDPELPRTAD